MMSESFIYCLEKVTDSEIEQKTEALIGLEKLALNKEITSIYKTCDSIEGLEESIIELTKNDHNFINYDVIYFVLEGEENNIVIDDYCYSLQEIAELFEGRMTGKVLHFSNTKSLNVTGAKAISGYGEKIYDISSTNLDLVYLSLFNEFNDILEIYDELNNNFNTLCELLEFKLYY